MSTDQDKVIRKLRAILSADVKGYSLLMSDDEAFTIRTLKEYRGIMSDLIKQHNGRVVDSPGDNVLAEFASVVDAVTCATEIQKVLKEKNKNLPDNRKLEFRIGVNIGDVVQDGDRIYGNGVNVAARIEGLSEPGGVSISRNAYGQIKDKLTFGYEYIGEHEVKNIKDPIRVYKVLLDSEDAGKLIGEEPRRPKKKWFLPVVVVAAIIATSIVWYFYQNTIKPEIEPALIENMAYPLPDKPSIAVLPFDNMTGDPEQEYFSDGVSEEIITALSKTDQLFVIARNSTFSYKDKPVKVKQIAEELGVRYVLEGSVRKSEDQVRITAQLIDAISGHHLWAERYDIEMKNIFSLQDEITLKIMSSLQVKLTEGEQARIWSKINNLDIVFKMNEALSLWRVGTMESHMRYGQIGQEIIDMAPESTVGYLILGWHHWFLAMNGISPDSIKKAFNLAQKVLSMDEFNASAHALLGSIFSAARQYEKAIAEGERSIELEPNGAMAHGLLGLTLLLASQYDEAIEYLNRGIRLNPFPAYWYFQHLGSCYSLKGQYEKALTFFEKALQRSPNNLETHLSLAAAYVLLERQDEAEAAAKKAIGIYHNFSVERYISAISIKNQADLKKFGDALRKAGLPE